MPQVLDSVALLTWPGGLCLMRLMRDERSQQASAPPDHNQFSENSDAVADRDHGRFGWGSAGLRPEQVFPLPGCDEPWQTG